ncbi:zinc protease PQQL-like isoform X2 [Amborella trichopoda]|uniref:zinc protease PQQL-like isoform X2 n=1 Tax=Amborella trichopoda TaxID=13333 RepID=UPI0009BFF8CB|nr:zinc protease PQQL-like isoform X2 [Amborella trichopoda]|eukprot:XP_020523529.1 zinc protease PQQL-like isoform X2 [Amborella trichopoda]
MEGSKYDDCLPIGLEKVIRTVSPETVEGFYQKWYHLPNMAAVSVREFPDAERVVKLIRKHFGQKVSASIEPFSQFHPTRSLDFQTSVMISCKIPVFEP